MDDPKRTFALAEMIHSAWYRLDCIGAIVEGALNVGKSSYGIQVIRELYPGDSWKRFLVFKPVEFMDLVEELIRKDERAKCILWDDAGLWLYAMDVWDPWVNAVIKFINVAKTVTAGLILTTPTKEMVIKRAHTIPGWYTANVVRADSKDQRVAKFYQRYALPSGRVRIRGPVIEDYFNRMLPQDVFDWYYPKRKMYAAEAVKLMRDAAAKRKMLEVIAKTE